MPHHGADETLKILVLDENPIRTAILEEGLAEAGYHNVTVLTSMAGLVDRVYALDPDVILIDLENPSRDVLEQLFQVSRVVRRAIAMFVDHSDSAMIEAAVDAGVSAYVVGGLQKQRVRPIIELTMSRFRAFSKLKAELEATKTALEERKIIERAKGILMKAKNIDEDAAYGLLRRAAMEQNKRIAEIAENLVAAASLLK